MHDARLRWRRRAGRCWLGILLLWPALALTLLFLLSGPAMAERLALVIGNSRYQHASVLANTLNDAQAVADALTKLGFGLGGGQPYHNLSKLQLEQVLKAFGPRAREAEAVVVYYAGHGVESGGANYLVPVDAELQHEVHLPLETVALDTVLEQIAGPRGWRLVILDACRNNPLAARMARGAGGRGVTRGLARVEPQGQTYIAYAARGGTEALDQDPAGSDHSPFAAVLLDYLSQPLPLERLFGAVREDVLKRTGGQQEPWLYGAFGRDPIYLTGGGGDRELVFWHSVKDSRNPAVFRIYLERYPSGTFAKLAQIRLAELEQLGSPVPPSSSPPPLQPVSVKQPPAPRALTGQEVYNKVCTACHAAGVMGAPKVGAKDQWEPRFAQGLDTLVNHAVNCIRSMPAKGGDPSLAEANLKEAIVYMLGETGIKTDPAPKIINASLKIALIDEKGVLRVKDILGKIFNEFEIGFSTKSKILWSPNGKYILVVDEVDKKSIYLVDLLNKHVKKWKEIPYDSFYLKWSPSSDLVQIDIVDSGRWRLDITSIDGNNRKTIYSGWEVNNTPTWGPDGKLLAVAGGPVSSNFNLYIINAETGYIKNMTPNSISTGFSGNWINDKKLIFSEKGNQGSLYRRRILDLITESTSEFFEDQNNIEGVSISPSGKMIGYKVENNEKYSLFIREKGSGFFKKIWSGKAIDCGIVSWSPEEEYLLFYIQMDRGGRDIKSYIYHLNDGTINYLTNNVPSYGSIQRKNPFSKSSNWVNQTSYIIAEQDLNNDLLRVYITDINGYQFDLCRPKYYGVCAIWFQ